MAVSWLVLEEMLERGDPAFVDALREQTDADQLGKFAAKWFNDRRREARRLLLEYLDRPLNAYRHEALVKRLFKLAEKANDDEVMGRFVVAFDRSVRRRRKKRYRYDWQTRESWEEESVRVPKDTVMPRDASGQRTVRNPRTGEQIQVSTFRWFRWTTDPEQLRKAFEGRRLFTVHTRNYLRRRAWRYFRKLGKTDPGRYITAVNGLLQQYVDADMPDGLALLDNWGLIHILFHQCPALVAHPHGWMIAPGRSLGELAPAPIFEDAWKAAPDRLIELLKKARGRPVRQWVIRLIQRDHGAVLTRLPLVDLLELLTHEDSDVVALAAEALRQAPGLDALSLDRWLQLLETPQPAALDIICELMAKHLQPERLTLEQAVKLASSRPLPVARLGLRFLQGKAARTEEECRALLGLVEAEAAPVRPELVRWARGVLSQSPQFQHAWVLEYLDSRHADVRAEGWAWFQEEPRAKDQVEIWQRLLESPYDDVRLKLIADLELRLAGRNGDWIETAQLNQELIKLMWASVLLHIRRGNRAKPLVVRQLVGRMTKRIAEAPALLPIVSVALRSVRGPEWRAGLAGVVQLVGRRPELEPAVREAFPELKMA
jgi:hypothetical protein